VGFQTLLLGLGSLVLGAWRFPKVLYGKTGSNGLQYYFLLQVVTKRLWMLRIKTVLFGCTKDENEARNA